MQRNRVNSIIIIGFTLVPCQVINDLYLGQGNPVPTNGSAHYLSVDKALDLLEGKYI